MAEVEEVPNASATLAELVKQLSEQTSRLARLEIELAKAEVREKGREAGVGAGMLAGAGVFALLALGALTACAILAIDRAVAVWLAALIVGAAYVVVAAALGLLGKRRLRRATPVVPQQATESVREDVQWAKTRAARH